MTAEPIKEEGTGNREGAANAAKEISDDFHLLSPCNSQAVRGGGGGMRSRQGNDNSIMGKEKVPVARLR